VQSEPAQGTAFQVFLPATQGAGIQEFEAEARAEEDLQGNETILLVEDEEIVRRPLRHIFIRKGYKLLEAREGKEALEICRENPGPLAMMITDIIMPRMNGLELADRALEIRPDLKVLYISGYHSRSRSCLERLEPGRNFLRKPFTPREILKKVREILDGPE
jgi:YesN/AraC family two-component response regulator